MATTPNTRTQAEYYIRSLANGSIDPAEVIAWADQVIVDAAKTEDWMLDLSTRDPGDRPGVLHDLHAVPGTVDEATLATLLAAKG
jgi:hypothetical protein